MSTLIRSVGDMLLNGIYIFLIYPIISLFLLMKWIPLALSLMSDGHKLYQDGNKKLSSRLLYHTSVWYRTKNGQIPGTSQILYAFTSWIILCMVLSFIDRIIQITFGADLPVIEILTVSGIYNFAVIIMFHIAATMVGHTPVVEVFDPNRLPVPLMAMEQQMTAAPLNPYGLSPIIGLPSVISTNNNMYNGNNVIPASVNGYVPPSSANGIYKNLPVDGHNLNKKPKNERTDGGVNLPRSAFGAAFAHGEQYDHLNRLKVDDRTNGALVGDKIGLNKPVTVRVDMVPPTTLPGNYPSQNYALPPNIPQPAPLAPPLPAAPTFSSQPPYVPRMSPVQNIPQPPMGSPYQPSMAQMPPAPVQNYQGAYGQTAQPQQYAQPQQGGYRDRTEAINRIIHSVTKDISETLNRRQPVEIHLVHKIAENNEQLIQRIQPSQIGMWIPYMQSMAATAPSSEYYLHIFSPSKKDGQMHGKQKSGRIYGSEMAQVLAGISRNLGYAA